MNEKKRLGVGEDCGSDGEKKYNCPLCQDMGFIQQLRDGQWVAVECSCIPRRRAIRLIEQSGLRKFLRDMTFARYETPQPWQQECKARAMEYLRQGGDGWFAILGQSGAGKTHLCTAICGQLLKRGVAVRYLEWVAFVSRLARLKFRSQEYADYYDPVREAECLYIDDLFKRPGRNGGWDEDFEYKLAFELIDHRTKAGLRTIISGEPTLWEIADKDEAIAGRIRQNSGKFCLVIERDKSKNYRLNGGAE